MTSGKANLIFVILLAAVAAAVAAILFLAPADPASNKENPKDRPVRAEMAYAKVRQQVDALRKEKRLADALRAYKQYPRDLLNSSETKPEDFLEASQRIEDEQRELVKEINELYKKDREKLTRLIVGDPDVKPPAPPNLDAALDLIEVMELYCYDKLLRDILTERQRIHDYYDRQVRDLYLKVQSEYRARMEKREFSEALHWMHDFVDHAPLPEGYQRKWLEFKGVEYAELKAAVDSSNFAKIAVLLEPHLMLVGKLEDMDTPRMILFDLLSASFACQAIEDMKTGLRYFAEQRTQIQSKQMPGNIMIAIDNGKYYFVGETGKRMELPPIGSMEVDDIAYFMMRGSNADMHLAVKAPDADQGYNIRIGVLYMYSPSPRDYIRAGKCFRDAGRLGSRVSPIFLEVLNTIKSSPKGPGR